MGEQMALSIILSVHYIRKRFRISTPISQSLFSISHTINSNMGCAITMGSIEPLVNLGICVWADRDIYASVLKHARNFEVYFDNDKLHKFACISDQGHDANSPQQPWHVYFTRRRARRTQSQVTHGFVACVVHPDPGGTYVSLEQRSLGLWRFQTVWDIAKADHRSR